MIVQAYDLVVEWKTESGRSLGREGSIPIQVPIKSKFTSAGETPLELTLECSDQRQSMRCNFPFNRRWNGVPKVVVTLIAASRVSQRSVDLGSGRVATATQAQEATSRGKLKAVLVNGEPQWWV